MLTEATVEHAFREYLPPDAKITFVEPGPYLLGAILNDTVQHWLRIGVYRFPTLRSDFLGWSCAYAEDGEVVICMELLRNLSHGLTEEEVDVLVRYTAAHEAHHLEHHQHGPVDIDAQLQRELDCDDSIGLVYPDLAAKIDDVYEHGAVYQRVLARVQALHAS